MSKQKLTPEQCQEIIDGFAEMLDDPTCEVEVKRGSRKWDDLDGKIRQAPNGTMTIILKKNGGAKDTYDDPPLPHISEVNDGHGNGDYDE